MKTLLFSLFISGCMFIHTNPEECLSIKILEHQIQQKLYHPYTTTMISTLRNIQKLQQIQQSSNPLVEIEHLETHLLNALYDKHGGYCKKYIKEIKQLKKTIEFFNPVLFYKVPNNSPISTACNSQSQIAITPQQTIPTSREKVKISPTAHKIEHNISSQSLPKKENYVNQLETLKLSTWIIRRPL